MKFPITINTATFMKSEHSAAVLQYIMEHLRKTAPYRASEWAVMIVSARRTVKAVLDAQGKDLSLGVFDWGTLEHVLAIAYIQATGQQKKNIFDVYGALHNALEKDPKYKGINERLVKEEAARREVQKLEAKLSEAKGALQDLVHENRLKERTEE